MYDTTSQSFSLIPLFIHFIHSKPTGDIVLEFDWFDDNRLTTTKTLGFFPLLGKWTTKTRYSKLLHFPVRFSLIVCYVIGVILNLFWCNFGLHLLIVTFACVRYIQYTFVTKRAGKRLNFPMWRRVNEGISIPNQVKQPSWRAIVYKIVVLLLLVCIRLISQTYLGCASNVNVWNMMDRV